MHMQGLFIDEEGHLLEGPNMNIGIITQVRVKCRGRAKHHRSHALL